ncbi:Aminoacylase-1 [Drechslerella dactyloides]|uniref:Aminoacylase-1 n=1 Tax=Drechslerella dactyloides TaxID=74499 RepID=A0AAD6IWG2_DREDA|nr:Aminoacylase-1 [Drechslerella dactyloides]
MRLHSSPRLLALSVAPLVVNSLQLPFGITLPAALDSRLSSLRTAVTQIQVPSFINKIIDPTGSSPLLSLHRDLVGIPSVTGDEEAVARFLEAYLLAKNFRVELIPVASPEYPAGQKRYNVLAYPAGGSRKAPILLTSHIDTVPPFIPFKDGLRTVYGRGSCDAKASVAAQIIAVEELLAANAVTEDTVALLFVVGEETTGDGMRHMNTLDMQWEAVVFGEPTELKLAVGHKGLAMLTVEARGRASHSGYPNLGVNANSHLINALYKLDHLTLPSSKLLGNSTLNVGMMTGGVAANVIPAFASAEVAIRIAAKSFQEVKDIVEGALKDVEGVEATWKQPFYDPVFCDHDIEGFDTIATSYGTDIPNLAGKHKKYLYGPGSILVAHGDNEKIDKSDLYEAVKGYKRIVKGILNAKAVAIVPPESASASAPVVTEAETVEAVTVSAKVEVPEVPANRGAEGKNGKEEEKVEYVTILPVDTA